MERMQRGVTYLNGRGGFLRERKDILFIVVSLTQVSRVKAIVDEYDTEAFMIVSDTSEVMGRGFTREKVLYQDTLRRMMLEQGRQEK